MTVCFKNWVKFRGRAAIFTINFFNYPTFFNGVPNPRIAVGESCSKKVGGKSPLFRNYSSMDCLDLSRLCRTTLFELKWCKEYFLLFPSSTKQNRYLCCAKVFNDLFFFCFARIVMFFKGWFEFNLLKWRWNIFLTVFIKHVFFFLKSCNKIISTPSWHLQNTFVFFMI